MCDSPRPDIEHAGRWFCPHCLGDIACALPVQPLFTSAEAARLVPCNAKWLARVANAEREALGLDEPYYIQGRAGFRTRMYSAGDIRKLRDRRIIRGQRWAKRDKTHE